MSFWRIIKAENYLLTDKQFGRPLLKDFDWLKDAVAGLK
jgi:hypothetical protein